VVFASSSNSTSSGTALVANGNLTVFFWMIFAVSLASSLTAGEFPFLALAP